MIRNSKGQLVEIGVSHQIRWNILREYNWGVPSVHINFIYYVTYVIHYLIMLQGRTRTGAYYMHENYNSHNQSESVWSCVWALLGGNK